jgi:cytochrome c peroxidase
VKPWPAAPEGKAQDFGRYEVTKQESDKMMFKVPGLRNVAKTAPYFHDGSAPDLEVAVQMMAEHQLGKTLSAEDVRLIVAFLGALTGEPTAEQMRKPELPASTPKTPKADPS